jgi:hypothetical protein
MSLDHYFISPQALCQFHFTASTISPQGHTADWVVGLFEPMTAKPMTVRMIADLDAI